MIKYSLICKDCNLTFESWFASSKEYEKLKKRKFLNCHSCDSSNVIKNLMAPSLIRQKVKKSSNGKIKKINEIKETISNYQKFIKNNFEYVGKNFAYEARSIHYNEKKEKNIYGTQVIPWIKDSN